MVKKRTRRGGFDLSVMPDVPPAKPVPTSTIGKILDVLEKSKVISTGLNTFGGPTWLSDGIGKLGYGLTKNGRRKKRVGAKRAPRKKGGYMVIPM